MLWLRGFLPEGPTVRSHVGQIGLGVDVLTSASSVDGEGRISCTLAHSRPIFSFNTWSSSRTERLRVAFTDMMVPSQEQAQLVT